MHIDCMHFKGDGLQIRTQYVDHFSSQPWSLEKERPIYEKQYYSYIDNKYLTMHSGKCGNMMKTWLISQFSTVIIMVIFNKMGLVKTSAALH